MKIILKSFLILTFSLTVCENMSEEAQMLIEHVKKSIHDASKGHSKITQDILAIDGMSSARGRHFLNNLCSLPGARYLEIGVWYGSTFISALYGNTETLEEAIAIDNWSEFGRERDTFMSNTNLYLPKNSFRIHEKDSFSIDLQNTFNHPINIYFYDGNHSVESQRKAFTYFDPVFADTFIAVIDDWRFKSVPQGTRQAFKELGYKILFEEICTAPAGKNDIGLIHKDLWWNGIYVAVIQKNTKS